MIPKVRELVVTDLLPKAYQVLKEELDTAPWSIKQKARQEIMRLAGIAPEEPTRNDAAEAAAFMHANNIQVTIINGATPHIEMELPEEYKEAVSDRLPLKVVDGEWSEAVPGEPDKAVPLKSIIEELPDDGKQD